MVMMMDDVYGVNRQNVPRQNLPGDKTSQGTKRPRDIRSPDIRSQGQNVPGTKRPRDKMSYNNYQVFKKHILG